MSNPWFRMHKEFRSDPKVGVLPEPIQLRFVWLLCLRCEGPTENLPEEVIRYALKCNDHETFRETKEMFLKMGFIDENWTIKNWHKRQFLSDVSTDRVKKFRANKGLKRSETFLKRGETKSETESETSPDTDTDTDTEKTKEQIPLPQDKPAVVKKVDPRFSLFRKDFETHYQRLNNILPPKDGKEAGNLSRWLKANPTVTQEQWRQILRNRRNSPLNHAAPLSRWIGNALAWLNHPADEFGKPITGANGNGKRAYTTTGEHNRAALYEALGYRDSDHGSLGPDGDREGWEGEPGIPQGDSGPIIEGTVGRSLAGDRHARQD